MRFLHTNRSKRSLPQLEMQHPKVHPPLKYLQIHMLSCRVSLSVKCVLFFCAGCKSALVVESCMAPPPLTAACGRSNILVFHACSLSRGIGQLVSPCPYDKVLGCSDCSTGLHHTIALSSICFKETVDNPFTLRRLLSEAR